MNTEWAVKRVMKVTSKVAIISSWSAAIYYSCGLLGLDLQTALLRSKPIPYNKDNKGYFLQSGNKRSLSPINGYKIPLRNTLGAIMEDCVKSLLNSLENYDIFIC